MSKTLLLDGNSLTYRAFFALPTDMATASGQVTNAVYGFTAMLVNILKDHKPDVVVVAFDRPEKTFRHEIVAEYKAQREAAPDILRQQMGLVRQILDVLAIPAVEMAGYEADDLIATLADQAEKAGDDVIIVTGDRDAYQLVKDPHIRVLYNRRGVSDYVLYDEAAIAEKTGVTPNKYIEYASLRGDPSDNLAGVPGVGEKTAAKLINDFGSIDGIYANVDSLSPKLRSNLIEAEPQVRKNLMATPLVHDVPIDFDITKHRLGPFDKEAARSLFQFLELRTLWDRMLDVTGSSAKGEELREIAVQVEKLTSTANSVAKIEGIFSESSVAVAHEWQPDAAYVLSGLALVGANNPLSALYFDAEMLADPKVISTLKREFESQGDRHIDVHDAKLLMHGLSNVGIDFRSIDLDTRVAAYLLDPSESGYELSELLLKYCGQQLGDESKAPSGQLDFGDHDYAAQTAGRAASTYLVAEKLRVELREKGNEKLYEEIERPLISVLARMEMLGIRVDVKYLQELADSLTTEAQKLESELHEIAGEQFNVNSTTQLRSILFDKLKLTPQKKTKTGYSTDAASLEKLRGEHKIVDILLRYREIEKLRNTYGESLLHEVASDGRIHATFNQTVARTGRLSSDKPNLHNIPVRSEEGRRFRRAFIPADGAQFVVADYNQIELRVIAHLADDPGLIEAFSTGQDIHRATASRVFGVKPEDVTFEQRNKAKMVAYGLAYGMEAYGLAQRLSIGVEEAAGILKSFFDAFPSIHSYMDATVAEARKKGYTETLFGRRRPIPELLSDNFRVRQAGERQAMNAGIQGLAADIFKVALIRIDEALMSQGLRARLVLQVHDEVLVEAPQSDVEAATKVTLVAMESACSLKVPLEVNVSIVDNWGGAK